MSLVISVNTEGVMVMLARAAEQLPFAMQIGLNRLANAGQKAEQSQMKRGFKLRREQFVVRGVKINKVDRATKTSWRVTINLEYPDARPFMDQHEQGGARTRRGGRFLWQPNQEVFKSKVIGAANPLSPKNLHMTKTPGGQIKGDQETFMVKTTSGQRLVLQRIAKGLAKGTRLKSFNLDNVHVGMGPRTKKGKQLQRGAGTRLLYRLVDRVRIPADLKFVQTITQEVAMQQAAIMDQAVRDALRTAR